MGLAGRVAAGPGRPARRARRRRRRSVQRGRTASCPASWRRSWRWPGRASWPASWTSPSGCTRSARAPTRPTSPRRSSAGPAWRRPQIDPQRRSRRSTRSPPPAAPTASRDACAPRCWPLCPTTAAPSARSTQRRASWPRQLSIPRSVLRCTIDILDAALQHVRGQRAGCRRGRRRGAGQRAVAAARARACVSAAAELESDRRERVQLVDRANRVRLRSVT